MKILHLFAVVAVAGLALCSGAASASSGESILFASDYGQARQPEIYSVGINGSRPVDVSRMPGPDESPSFSPSGRQVAWVTQTSRRPGEYRLVVADANGRHQHVLPTQPEYIPASQRLAWSHDGKSILFMVENVPTSEADLYLIRADGRGRQQRLVAGYDGAFSPDGRRLAYIQGTGTTLVIARADGSHPSTPVDLEITWLAWSPDSRHLAVGSGAAGTYVVDLAGQTRLLGPPPNFFGASWAPGGRRVVFGGPKGVTVSRADGTGERVVSHAFAPFTAWSPNGRWILYGRDSIFIIHPDGSRRRQIGRDVNGDSAPVWAPHAGRVAYETSRSYDYEVYGSRPGGSGRRQLTNNTVDDIEPRLSPDGTRIAFVREKGTGNTLATGAIWLMNRDGSGQHELTAVGDSPSWSRDSSRIVFSKTGEIETTDIATQIESPVTAGEQPAWSPSGQTIAFIRHGTEDALYTVRADGTMVAQVLSGTAAQTVAGGYPGFPLRLSSPAWSSDARTISVQFVWDDVHETHSGALLVAADGSNLRIAPWIVPGYNTPMRAAVAWSPDGTQVALSGHTSGEGGVIVEAVDGGSPRTITPRWFGGIDADWGPRP